MDGVKKGDRNYSSALKNLNMKKRSATVLVTGNNRWLFSVEGQKAPEIV